MLDPTERRRRVDELAASASALAAKLGARRVKDRQALAYAQVARRAEVALLRQLADEVERNERRRAVVTVVTDADDARRLVG
jgi:hypothetical protein